MRQAAAWLGLPRLAKNEEQPGREMKRFGTAPQADMLAPQRSIKGQKDGCALSGDQR